MISRHHVCRTPVYHHGSNFSNTANDRLAGIESMLLTKGSSNIMYVRRMIRDKSLDLLFRPDVRSRKRLGSAVSVRKASSSHEALGILG